MSFLTESSITTSDAAVGNAQPKSDESVLVFRDASENFPYRMKGEAAVLELLHTTSWAKTSLGPAKDWPPILLNTIRLMLVSRFAMCCWWGPELRMLYNLKYASLLGKRHPNSLGNTLRSAWHDVWNDIAGLLNAVYEDGESVFLKEARYWMTRNGWVEETWFTYQYSPIYDDLGQGPHGIYHVVTDETLRVFSERDMRTLRDLSTATNTCITFNGWKRSVSKIFKEPSHCIDVPFIYIYEIDRETREFKRIVSEGANPEQKKLQLPQHIPIWEEFDVVKSDSFSAENMRIPSKKFRGSEASLETSTISDVSEAPNGSLEVPKPKHPDAILKHRLTKVMNDCYTHNSNTMLKLPLECLLRPDIVLPDSEKSLLTLVPPYTAMVAPIHGSSNNYSDVSLIAVLGINRFREYDTNYRSYFDLLVSQLSSSLATTNAVEESQLRADELAELNRSKTTFFYCSHEFRTPLSLILGPIEQVMLDENLHPKNKELAQMAHRNANRLLKLVNSLLQYTQLENGRMHAQFKAIKNLPDITREIASAFDTVATRFNLQFIVDCPSWDWTPPANRKISQDDISAFVDVDIWEIIILNLLSNAFKHCLKGSVRLTLRRHLRPSSSSPSAALFHNPLTTVMSGSHQVSTPESTTSSSSANVSSAGYYELCVTDTGNGIAESDLQRIFDRFYSVRNPESRSHEGIGIGLSFIRDLIETQKGLIAVESAVGQGSTFTVRLPLGYRHLNQNQVIRDSECGSNVTSPDKSLSEKLTTVSMIDSTTKESHDVNHIMPKAGRLFVAETAGWNSLNVEEEEQPNSAENQAPQPESLFTPNIEVPEYITVSEKDIFKPTVLVCDDNFDMRSYIKHTLEDNFNIIEASNGRDAFNIAVSLAASEASDPNQTVDEVHVPERKIDLVLADVMMPVMDGIELARTLRAHPMTRTLPIIMLTARAASGDSMSGLFAGADDYLYKPFDAQELIARVTTHCNLYRMRVEYADARNKIAVLEAANDAKSKLIALVSHELRTPLQSIIGTVELLREGNRFEEERTDLDNIHYSSQVLSSLISDILDVAKMDAGNFVFEPADFNPRVLAQHCCDILTEKANARGLDLVCHVDSGVLQRVNQDPARIRQCISNMLSNAVKFTERGYVVMRLYSVIKYDDGRPVRRFTYDELPTEDHWPDHSSEDGDPAASIQLLVEVEDTGIGLAEESLTEIFEPFCQANNTSTRPYEGVGLGLAITKQLVEKAGGEIGLSSELGKGSTFWITWPVSPPTSAYRAPGEDQNADDNPTRTDDLQVPRDISVLLLTKNQVTSAAISEHLKSVKLQNITVSPDPTDALEQLSSADRPFDMLITDSLLESSCIPVLRKCRELKAYVLMIVIRGVHRTLSKSLSELSDDVIPRPVHRANLLDKLNKYVAERRNRKLSITSDRKSFIPKLEASLKKQLERASLPATAPPNITGTLSAPTASTPRPPLTPPRSTDSFSNSDSTINVISTSESLPTVNTLVKKSEPVQQPSATMKGTILGKSTKN
ncbi:hypothetical protein NQZ79_g8416 [Umbelopsis isabellina]|nr:hypothetical protein NQZ79_g8416 [Umbelopsis isabellina]